MKRLMLALFTIVLPVIHASAQGSITYSINVSGAIVARVYGPETDVATRKFGNTVTQTPSGTQVYTGVLLAGSGYTAQLFAANGSGQPEGILTAVPGSLTTFRTGSLAGTFAPSTLVIPQVPIGGTGTFQLRVWDNLGGVYTSWDETAFVSTSTPYGRSGLFEISGLTDGTSPPNMTDFRSFGLVIIPEPTTYALLGLGILSLVMFRRQK